MITPLKPHLDILVHSYGSTGASFYDHTWPYDARKPAANRAICMPGTEALAMRFSQYVPSQKLAKKYAAMLQSDLNLLGIWCRVDAHRVPYGVSKGAWKIEAYVPR